MSDRDAAPPPLPVRSRMRRIAFALAAGVALLGPAESAQLTTPRVAAVHRSAPLITGVQLFFGGRIAQAGYQPRPTAAAMHALNAVSARDTLPWPSMAGLSGPQVLARYPALVDLTRPSGAPAPAILTLHGVIRAMDDGQLPHSPEALRAFAEFAAGAAANWTGGRTLFEIWNEWDKGAFRGDYGTPESYSALVRATAPALRRAAPDATILAGAAADDRGRAEFEWTKAMIAAGGLAPADALSVHLYDHCAPPLLVRAAAELIGRLDDLHAYAAAHAPGKADIYVSEFGWPTSRGRCGVDPEAAAENVAQFILLASTRPWIRGVWYYELKNSGHDPASLEDNFGLMTYDYRPKPAFCAYQAAARIVRTDRPVRVTQQGGAVRVDFEGKNGPLSAIWLADRGRPMQFRARAASVQPVCANPGAAPAGWTDLSARPLLVRGLRGDGATAVTFRAAGTG